MRIVLNKSAQSHVSNWLNNILDSIQMEKLSQRFDKTVE